MAGSKRGPALFEVIRREEGSRAVRRRGRTGLSDREQPPEPEGQPEEPREPAPPPPPPGDAEPFFELLGERVRFTLTQRRATIAVSVAVIVLGGICYLSYALGHRRGMARGIHRGKEMAQLQIQGPLEDEIDRARRSMVTGDLFEGIGEDPTIAADQIVEDTADAGPRTSPGQAVEPAEVPWVTGQNYIVVQDFKAGDRADLLDAQQFLHDQGVQTAVVALEQAGPYRYRLIAVAGFNLEDPVQKKLAGDYMERVRRIGKAYSGSGGRYDFQSAYLKKLTSDRW